MSEIKQFIYKLKPTRVEMLRSGLTPEEEKSVSEHFHYLKNLCDQGVVVLAGRTLTTDETTFGIAILNASSEQDALSIMTHDPAVVKHVMHAELFPFRIAMQSAQK
ncbi:hypothetical protein HY229_05890 [Candidatus Acetothermia bacterium]|nr:hypothetical protein [Candidatus Acetothermia bacterium]MBI3643614.1 hypothetical protein [Candidatus Acetothermia bacterium]